MCTRMRLDGLLSVLAAALLVIGASTASAAPGGCWETRTPMPTVRGALGVGVVDGVLYAVGGDGPTGLATGTVEAYNRATDSWTSKASMPTARYGVGVGVVNGILYAVGGYTSSDFVATVEAYQSHD